LVLVTILALQEVVPTVTCPKGHSPTTNVDNPNALTEITLSYHMLLNY